jgi:hypothetical protein
MDDMKSKAKKKILKELSEEMGGIAGDRYSNHFKDKMESVKVSSDSPEGLEAGLSKAQEILKKRKAMTGKLKEEMEEESEEKSSDGDMKEEIKRLREQLKELKK